jgi:hypothetical protein
VANKRWRNADGDRIRLAESTRMYDESCCCDDTEPTLPCSACLNSLTSESITVTIAGLTDSFCTNCDFYNRTYVLDFHTISAGRCNYRLDFGDDNVLGCVNGRYWWMQLSVITGTPPFTQNGLIVQFYYFHSQSIPGGHRPDLEFYLPLGTTKANCLTGSYVLPGVPSGVGDLVLCNEIGATATVNF